MSTFLTSFSELEFRDFLKDIIKEVLIQEQTHPRTNLSQTFDIVEAADFLKLKVNTLYEKTSKKLIPHFKRGNKLYFNRQELEEWIKSGKVKTTSEMESEATVLLLNSNRAKKPQQHNTAA